MNIVSPSTFHPDHPVGLPVTLAVLALGALVLLACAVSGLFDAPLTPAEAPLLSPFRWLPLAANLV